jgi:Domain of unknown function (DUF3291)
VNALADTADGFVWRLQTEEGNATGVHAFRWDVGDGCGVIVNLSVWQDVEHLTAFVYGAPHREVMRRRREWFRPVRDAYTVSWWVPAGEVPTTDDAERRLALLRRNGPTPDAFTLRDHFPPPA